MKKLLAFLAIVMFVGTSFSSETVHRRIGEYLQHGDYDWQLVETALDSNCAQLYEDILECIDTVSVFQFRPIAVQITGITDDTVETTCFTVPVGMTATLRAVQLSAAVEANCANPAQIQLEINNLDVSGSDTDVLVTKFSIDADSAAYLNVALALTLADSGGVAMGAGDVIQAKLYADSTIDVVGEGITLMFDIDWSE